MLTLVTVTITMAMVLMVVMVVPQITEEMSHHCLPRPVIVTLELDHQNMEVEVDLEETRRFRIKSTK